MHRGIATLIRLGCILVPFPLFLLLRAFDAKYYTETSKDDIGGALILAWTILVGLRMAAGLGVALSQEYGRPFVASLKQQACILLFASLFLDSGLTLRACLLAVLLFWMLAGLIIARRPATPRPSDTAWISWSFPVLAFLVTAAAWFATVAMSAMA